MDGKNSIKDQMNSLGGEGIPFVFLIDFELEKPQIFRVDEVDTGSLLFDLNGVTNRKGPGGHRHGLEMRSRPQDREEYLVKFTRVKEEIAHGNTYLLNLTCSTPVELNCSLMDIYYLSRARYRVWLKDQFVCFSPEIFVRISDGKIRSFPMKGTIDAAIPGAKELILNDPKETAEHYTIVDLIRNDLGCVSERVRVERFRYTETIETGRRSLLQVSSEISGDLPGDYSSRIGDIVYALLPAGSVSGAPKRRTTEIIAAAEGEKRGYYTGIFGLFDGSELDSCVLIRYIEATANGYRYRSGGGITSFSDPRSEYDEMTDKIYVPVI